METECCSETLVYNHKTTPHNNPEDHNLKLHRHENLIGTHNERKVISSFCIIPSSSVTLYALY